MTQEEEGSMGSPNHLEGAEGRDARKEVVIPEQPFMLEQHRALDPDFFHWLEQIRPDGF